MHSFNPAQAGTVALTMTEATLTIADNNGSPASFTVSTTLALNVVLTDPCESTSIATLTISALSVTHGATTNNFEEWDLPAVQVDTDHSNTGLCGDLKFEVYSDTSDSPLSQPWAVLSAESNGKQRLTINTSADMTLIGDEASVDRTVQIKTYLESYPSR